MPASNTYHRNRSSHRNRTRREEQADALVIALTAQVLLCILLLLAAVLVKKMDEVRYSDIKNQYNIMVTDPLEGEKALTYLNEAEDDVTRWFGALENWISSMLGRFSGNAVAQQPSQPEESWADSIDEPVDGAAGYGYDYLNNNELPTVALSLGQGGWNPVETEGTERLSAPQGSALSPVTLNASAIPPVSGVITSDFSYRYHPISGDSDFHTGMDIAAEEGRVILSALPGTVVETGESSSYGLYIRVEHSANLQTFYAHCSEIIAKEGMVVRQGDRIAKVGQTGVTTGPHLHLEVLVDGMRTDPAYILDDHIQLME